MLFFRLVCSLQSNARFTVFALLVFIPPTQPGSYAIIFNQVSLVRFLGTNLVLVCLNKSNLRYFPWYWSFLKGCCWKSSSRSHLHLSLLLQINLSGKVSVIYLIKYKWLKKKIFWEMQVLSNLYNASSQARTKQSLQDDKSFWNPIIRHKSISKNLHGKQCALGESVAKNSQKSGSEHAGLCDCWQQALHSARQQSKRGEWLWERFKNKEFFTFSLGNPMPSCPALSSLSPLSFSSMLRALSGAFSREGEFLLVLEKEAEVGEERAEIFLCSYRFYLGLWCCSQCPWRRVGRLRALQWGLGYPCLSVWCLQFELV